MVFQVDAPIALWGAAPPGVSVDVAMGAVNASTTADARGLWRAALPAVSVPGGPYTIHVSAGNASAVLRDVLIGTVLICGGQSNMAETATPTNYAFNGTASAQEAEGMPFVRLYSVGELATQGLLPPQVQFAYPPRLPWSVANYSLAANYSGVCWMTAKVLARALGPTHPLGLIETAWGGTCIQAWLPAAALTTCGPVPPAQGWQTNSTLYNQLVAPLANVVGGGGGLTVAGVVFYQGESNALFFRAGYYECALAALLASWRAAFGNPAAWFGVVQLAPWTGYNTQAAAAADVRNAQLAVVLADAHATCATAVDLGDAGAPKTSIHPRPKQQLGARLAAGALQHLLGDGGAGGGGGGAPTRGPLFAAAAAGGGAPGVALSATVTFAPPHDAPGALVLANVSAWPGLAPASECPSQQANDTVVCAGFELLDGGSGTWWPATAALRADAAALVLEAPGAPAGAVLAATRNGFAVWPQVSLYASPALGGLPAYPWGGA